MKISVYQNKTLIGELSVLDDDIVYGGELFIGRSDDCHIILDSHQVSRHHAIVYYENSQLKIKTNSQYGNVKINGSDITDTVVPMGGKIEIYDFELVFENFMGALDAPASTPAQEEADDITQIVTPALDDNLETPEVEGGKLGGLGFDEADDLINEETIVASGDDDLLQDGLTEDDYDLSGNEAENLEEGAFENSEGVIVRDDSYPAEDEDLLGSSENDELGDSVLDDNYDESLESPLDEDETYSHEYDGGEPTNFEEPSGLNDEDSFEDQQTSQMDDMSFSDIENEETENLSDDFGDDGGFGEEADFGGGDNDFGGGDSFGDEGSKTQVITSFAQYQLKIFGEFAPFDSYRLDDPITKIGRDPNECQIILDDPEVSKVHAILKKSAVDCILEDNESSNGIIFNGERVNKAELSNGDEFIIGETTFTVSISSDLLDSERGRLMPVEENQEVLIEDEGPQDMSFGNENDGDFDFSAEEEQEVPKSLIEQLKRDPKKRNIFIVVGILLAFILFTDDPKPEKKKEKKKAPVAKKKETKKSKYSPEKLEILESNYQLARVKFKEGNYDEAKEYINLVMKIDPKYKTASTLYKSIQESLDAIKRIEEEKIAAKERAEKLKKVAKLVEEAKKAVEERKVEVARGYFAQIYEIDPENIDVPPMKIEIDSYVQEEERKKQEKALKIAARKAMEEKLKPGEVAYIKKDYYEASIELTKFLSMKITQEEYKDLVTKASNMLDDSNAKLQQKIEPLISKARSYKEGQDLKQAYEAYDDVLKYQPSNEEALNEKIRIFEVLYKRSKKVFREALIKEDLSDFANAKEKFEEVKQISPINSEYYNKATDKLKNYLE